MSENNDNNAPKLSEMYHYVADRAQQHQHLPIKERYRRAIHTTTFKEIEYLFRCRATAMLLVGITVFIFTAIMKIFFSHLEPSINQKISWALIIYVVIALIVSWRLGTRYAMKRLKKTTETAKPAELFTRKVF
jgi:hypothetical protein